MLYETTRQAPEPGSITEVVFLFLYLMREERVFQANMVQASAAVAAGSDNESAGKQLQNQLDQFIESYFPYLAGQRAKETERMKKILDDTVGTAFKVTRMELPRRRFDV